MERNSRRKLIGVVVSDKMQKTITVLVQNSTRDSLYGKKVKNSKRYKAHDELEVANVGDKVLIQETRPLSATKRFNLVEVLEKAKSVEKVKEVA